MNIGFIGVGNQATAMLRGIAKTKTIDMQKILAFDIDTSRLQQTAAELGFRAAASAQEVAGCDMVVLAVKPHQLEVVLQPLQQVWQQRQPLLLSIAAGTTLAQLEAFAGEAMPIARAMPNQNAAIAQSMTAYCTNKQVTEPQQKLLHHFCAAFGDAIALEEHYFSVFTALAGSGPAFAFLFVDQMARAGVKLGMNRALAQRVAAQTVLGSVQLLQTEDDTHPQELIDRVCSPGGTTIAGIAALQEHGFENAINKAVEAACKRDHSM